jgi:NTE family protein
VHEDPSQAALVLGGGGLTGIAWTTGLLHGLAECGVDLTGAGVIVGTSAGAAVGAQVATGRPLDELLAAQLAEATAEIAAEIDLDVLIPIFGTMAGGGRLDAAGRAGVGAMAIDAPTVTEPVRRAVIEARLGTDTWPERALKITAVDAGTGELRVFDRASGVGLVDAVAASCAVPGVWPPVTIGDTRYIDGGVRSVTNADLAAGCDPVVVMVPLPAYGEAGLLAEVEQLRAAGSRVVLVRADDASTEAMGFNPLDPTKRRASAEAGRRQAAAHAAELAAIYS